MVWLCQKSGHENESPADSLLCYKLIPLFLLILSDIPGRRRGEVSAATAGEAVVQRWAEKLSLVVCGWLDYCQDLVVAM